MSRNRRYSMSRIADDKLVFLSGVFDAQQGTEKPFEEECRLAFESLRMGLKVANTEFSKVVHVNVHLKNLDDAIAMDEIWRSVFNEKRLPARTVIVVKDLPIGVRIQLDVIALKGFVREMNFY